MEWLKILFSFLGSVIPTLTTFIVGRKSKELEELKDENKKLKKYKEIDEKDIYKNQAYEADNWK